MSREVLGHAFSKREKIIGTITFLSPLFVFGAKILSEQITQEQIKTLERKRQEAARLNNTPSNIDCGDSGIIYSESKAYAS